MAHIKATKKDIEIAARLRDIREQLFGSRGQTLMAKSLGIPRENYRKYETAQVRLPNHIMALLASKKNINLTWLITGQGSMFLKGPSGVTDLGEEKAVYGERAVSIPVLESVGARDPQDINELKPVDQVILDKHFTTPGMVCLRIRGNSMDTEIRDKSIVGVDVRKGQIRDLQTRKVYVLWVRQEGMIIRRLYKEGKNLSFIPDNPTIENRPYTYKYIKKERRYDEELVINGRVEWVLNQLTRD